MRGNKLEKSHIHILESETQSRESRVTESAQEIVDSIPQDCIQYIYVYHLSTLIYFWWGDFTAIWGFYLVGCLTVKN